MSDVQQLLRRQARWQKSRQALPWPEKIRLAQQMRDSIKGLRAGRAEPSGEISIPSQTQPTRDTRAPRES